MAVLIQGACDLRAVKEDLEGALRRLGVDEPDITITVAGNLERVSTGKLKRFVPLSPGAG